MASVQHQTLDSTRVNQKREFNMIKNFLITINSKYLTRKIRGNGLRKSFKQYCSKKVSLCFPASLLFCGNFGFFSSAILWNHLVLPLPNSLFFHLIGERCSDRGATYFVAVKNSLLHILSHLLVSPQVACYGVLRFVMESGAKGCEVIVCGKLRAQRAKSMKFKDGYMISSGQPGVLGIKVKIMLDWDPKGKQGPMTPLPDLVTIHPPKEEEEFIPLVLTDRQHRDSSCLINSPDHVITSA
ncbi:hypothetical protein ACJRO7_013773 [Eucalyptus globulus]|uniref:Small ribosomal subunit protein uS3 C-terminal domain-containing protein n=1 Tax=Eucalyptus globulus TaxID=34317 RepID=A0ABD3L8M2_EUCGL